MALVVLAGAGLDGSARDLPVRQPAGGVGAEGDALGLGGRVRVPQFGVDLAAPVGELRFGVDAGGERLRRGHVAAVWGGVADLVAAGRKLPDVAERPSSPAHGGSQVAQDDRLENDGLMRLRHPSGIMRSSRPNGSITCLENRLITK